MRKVTFIFLFFILMMPMVVFAQEGEVPEASETMLYIQLLFNVGLVGVIVQLIKTKLLPIIKEKVPYLIPFIAMGMGAVIPLVLSKFGIDLTPVGNLFETAVVSGSLASVGFVGIKELHNAVTGNLG